VMRSKTESGASESTRMTMLPPSAWALGTVELDRGLAAFLRQHQPGKKSSTATHVTYVRCSPRATSPAQQQRSAVFPGHCLCRTCRSRAGRPVRDVSGVGGERRVNTYRR
jgi:hypothetical protein